MCKSLGTAMITPAISRCANNASTLGMTCALGTSQTIFAAASGLMSHTAAISRPACCAWRACTWPIDPQPMIPILAPVDFMVSVPFICFLNCATSASSPRYRKATPRRALHLSRQTWQREWACSKNQRKYAAKWLAQADPPNRPPGWRRRQAQSHPGQAH